MTTFTATSFPLIVGDGRLARHWKHYLKLHRLPFLEWNRREAVSFGDFARQCAGQISLVYVLISDSAIETFYQEHHGALPAGTPWYHASGALHVGGMIDAHPLMTFAQDTYDDAKIYEELTITSTCDVADLAPLLQGLHNPTAQISVAQKPLYHALCVLGGAGTGTLWMMLESEFQKIGIASRVWKPYQQQIFANLLRDCKSSITGPWVRGDAATIAKNQNALQNAEARELYQILKGIFDGHAKH